MLKTSWFIWLLFACLQIGSRAQIYTVPSRSRGSGFPLPNGASPVPPWYHLSSLPHLLNTGAVHPPAGTLLLPIPAGHPRIMNDRHPSHVFSRQFPMDTNSKNPVKLKINGIKGSTISYPMPVTTPSHQWTHPTHFPPIRVKPNVERHIPHPRIPASHRTPIIDLQYSHPAKPQHRNPSMRPQVHSKDNTNSKRHRWPPFPHLTSEPEIEETWPHRSTQYDYYRDLSKMRPLHDEYNKYNHRNEYETERDKDGKHFSAYASGESEEYINRGEELRKQKLHYNLRKELEKTRRYENEEKHIIKEIPEKDSFETFGKVCKTCGISSSANVQKPEYHTKSTYGNRRSETIHPHQKYSSRHISYPKTYRSLWNSDESEDEYEEYSRFGDSSELYKNDRRGDSSKRTSTLPSTLYSREYDDEIDDDFYYNSNLRKQNYPKPSRKVNKSTEKYYQLEEALKTIVKEYPKKSSRKSSNTKKVPDKTSPKETPNLETFRNVKIYDADFSNEGSSNSFHSGKYYDSVEEMTEKSRGKTASNTNKTSGNSTSEWWHESTKPVTSTTIKSLSAKNDQAEKINKDPNLETVSYFDAYSDEADTHLEIPESSFADDEIMSEDGLDTMAEPQREILRVDQKHKRTQDTTGHNLRSSKNNPVQMTDETT